MKNALQKLIDLYTKANDICVKQGLVNTFTRHIDRKIVDWNTTPDEAIKTVAEETLYDMAKYNNVFQRLAEIDTESYVPAHKQLGICANVLGGTDGIYELAVFLTWPKSTLCCAYPVPNTANVKWPVGPYSCNEDGVLTEEGIYDYNSAVGRTVWDKETQYGRDRYDLLEYLVSVSRYICEVGA